MEPSRLRWSKTWRKIQRGAAPLDTPRREKDSPRPLGKKHSLGIRWFSKKDISTVCGRKKKKPRGNGALGGGKK